MSIHSTISLQGLALLLETQGETVTYNDTEYTALVNRVDATREVDITPRGSMVGKKPASFSRVLFPVSSVTTKPEPLETITDSDSAVHTIYSSARKGPVWECVCGVDE